jgi:translation initiation factor 3 subunit E
MHRSSEFTEKRESAVSTNERLATEAQAVLDVIENPDVAQALRQDKMQNLQYLKDNYNVRLTCFVHRRFRSATLRSLAPL